MLLRRYRQSSSREEWSMERCAVAGPPKIQGSSGEQVLTGGRLFFLVWLRRLCKMFEQVFGRMQVCVLALAITGIAIADEAENDGGVQGLSLLKETTQIRMESLKDSVRKDLDSVLARFDALDKRVDAQNAKVDQGLSLLGDLLSGLGVVLTLFGVLSFFSVQAKAKKEASRVSEDWFEANSDSFKSKISSLQVRLGELEAQAKESFERHVQLVEAGARDAREKIQSSIDNAVNVPDIDAGSVSALAEVAKNAKSKPEEEYSFEDLSNLAFNYYSVGDKVGAVKFWDRAAKHPSATVDQIADSLFNLGVMYKQLDQFGKALSIYDSVIERFSESTSHYAREQAAKSMVNKCSILAIMENWEQQKSCLRSFFEWEERHREDGFNSQLSKALNGYGFVILCEAKKYWSDEALRRQKLNEAYQYFQDAVACNDQDAFALGNIAYCSYLMGRNDVDFSEKIKDALLIGGEHLYTSTLTDFLIHPVQDLDDKFEAILRGEWAKLQN